MERDAGVSDRCCVASVEARTSSQCPLSGGDGRPVDWTTVAALVSGSVPRRQEVYLCPDAACELVYFGDRGLTLRMEEVRVAPGWKLGSSGLACYCFEHSREAIVDEARTLRRSPTAEAIRTQVRAKNCACEVRSPSGKCCLKEIDELVRSSVKGVA